MGGAWISSGHLKGHSARAAHQTKPNLVADKPPVLISQPGCALPDQLEPVGGMENHGLGDRPLLNSGSELPVPGGM